MSSNPHTWPLWLGAVQNPITISLSDHGEINNQREWVHIAQHQNDHVVWRQYDGNKNSS